MSDQLSRDLVHTRGWLLTRQSRRKLARHAPTRWRPRTRTRCAAAAATRYCEQQLRRRVTVSNMGFERRLLALGFPEARAFDGSSAKQASSLASWLEDRVIRYSAPTLTKR